MTRSSQCPILSMIEYIIAYLLQVQAALEGASSVGNSRSTSHAPSRAHSPDLYAVKQTCLDPALSHNDSVANSDSRHEREELHDSKSEVQSNQDASSAEHSANSRGSTVLSRPSSSVQKSCQQINAAALAQLLTADDHVAQNLVGLATSKPSSSHSSSAISRDSFSPASVTAAVAAYRPPAAPSPEASPAVSPAASGVRMSTPPHDSPDVAAIQCGSSPAQGPVRSSIDTEGSSSPDQSPNSNRSIRSKQSQPQGSSHHLAQSQDSSRLLQGKQTRSSGSAHHFAQCLNGSNLLHSKQSRSSGASYDSAPDLLLKWALQSQDPQNTGDQLSATNCNLPLLARPASAEPDSSVLPSLSQSHAQSPVESIAKSADMGSDSMMSDTHKLTHSTQTADSTLTGDLALLSTASSSPEATTSIQGAQSSKQQLVAPAADKAAMSQEHSSQHAAVAVSVQPTLSLPPVPVQTAADLAQHVAETALMSSLQHESVSPLPGRAEDSEAEAVNMAASDSGSTVEVPGCGQEGAQAAGSATSSNGDSSVYSTNDGRDSLELLSSPEQKVCHP